MLEAVPGTNQYLAIRVKFLAQGNNRGSNPRQVSGVLTDYVEVVVIISFYS